MSVKSPVISQVAVIAIAIFLAVSGIIAVDHGLSSYQAGVIKIYSGKSSYRLLSHEGNEFEFFLRTSLPCFFYASASLILFGAALLTQKEKLNKPIFPKFALGIGVLILNVAALMLIIQLVLY